MNLSKNLRIVFILATGGLLPLVMILLAIRPIRAAGPWYVAPGGDDGNDCLSPGAPCTTINGAIGKATSGDTIYVAIGTYTGTGGEVVLLDKDATLSGGWNETFTEQSGASTIDGEDARRCVVVNSGITAVVEHLAVRRGWVDYPGGGGILNSGNLTLDDCTIEGNSAWSGGGIRNDGTLILKSTTVAGNTASWGGGIRNDGTLALNNSTVSRNTAEGGGGIFNNGTLTLNSSTVSRNFASGQGGGICDDFGVSVTLQNSVVADNTGSGQGPDCWGTIGSSGYSLVGNTSGCTFSPGTGDLTDVPSWLGLLIGTPGYHPLLPGSPAIDAGNPAGCTDYLGNALDTDQRGAARVGRCDMGSYEYTTPGPASSMFAFTGTPQDAMRFTLFEIPLRAVIVDSIGTPVGGSTVTFSAPASGASGTFVDSGTFTATAVSDQHGIATAADFAANGLEGSYTVTGTATGVSTPASFLMANTGGWYVALDGDDSSDCQTPETPCATINGALGKAGLLDGDTVLVGQGTYTGDGNEVVLLHKSVRLVGGWNETFTEQSGTSTIDGEESRRGIAVNGGVTASVERFTVQNGLAEEWTSGGGISNSGTLTLNHCIVTGNRTTYGRGGGIGNAGTLVLNSSAVSGNTSSDAGGGIDNTVGTLTLNNSTVSGNTVTNDNNGGGIYNYATMSLYNSTITGNSAMFGGGISGGSGSAILQNTILAGNRASYSGPDCGGTIASSGYNLIGDTSDCSFTPTTGDLIDVDARLFPLIGLPGYHPLLPGSPAIDGGNPAGCTDHLGDPLTTDLRSSPRPLDGDGDGKAICDIGSYEFDPDNDPLTAVYLPVILRNH